MQKIRGDITESVQISNVLTSYKKETKDSSETTVL